MRHSKSMGGGGGGGGTVQTKESNMVTQLKDAIPIINLEKVAWKVNSEKARQWSNSGKNKFLASKSVK